MTDGVTRIRLQWRLEGYADGTWRAAALINGERRAVSKPYATQAEAKAECDRLSRVIQDSVTRDGALAGFEITFKREN